MDQSIVDNIALLWFYSTYNIDCMSTFGCAIITKLAVSGLRIFTKVLGLVYVLNSNVVALCVCRSNVLGKIVNYQMLLRRFLYFCVILLVILCWLGPWCLLFILFFRRATTTLVVYTFATFLVRSCATFALRCLGSSCYGSQSLV